MSDHWERVWNNRDHLVGERDPFRQVGKTVRGRPISADQFAAQIQEIVTSLALSSHDRLLDLCCGNGLTTQALAGSCRRIVGVDFSGPLIDVARQVHCPANVTYRQMPALEANAITLRDEQPFDKVLLYDSFQYFRPADLPRLLENIRRLTPEGRRIFIGGIPDRAKRPLFYNSARKRLMYFVRRLTGTELLGTWWDPDGIVATCRKLGFRCEYVPQSPRLYNAHFRFGVLIQ